MTNHAWELTLIVVDKGLLALLLLLAGAITSRSLERLKSSLSWGAEVLKQKLLIAKDAVAALEEVSDAHLQLTGSIATFGALTKEIYDRFHKACRRLEVSGKEARLLLSQSTVDMILDVRDAALRGLFELSGSGMRMVNADELAIRDVPPKVKSAREAELEFLKAAFDAAVKAIQSEFPSTTPDLQKR
jgi:hypothetical protein